MWLIIPVLLTVHVIICLLLVAAVLMQLPRSEGLGAAFGGGMTENLFGAQTTHVLTKFTVWLGVGFFVVTLLLAMAYAHNQPTGSKLERELMATPSPAAGATPQPVQPPSVQDGPTDPPTPASPSVAEGVGAPQSGPATTPEAPSAEGAPLSGGEGPDAPGTAPTPAAP